MQCVACCGVSVAKRWEVERMYGFGCNVECLVIGMQDLSRLLSTSYVGVGVHEKWWLGLNVERGWLRFLASWLGTWHEGRFILPLQQRK